jgi:hypothetical protein
VLCLLRHSVVTRVPVWSWRCVVGPLVLPVRQQQQEGWNGDLLLPCQTVCNRSEALRTALALGAGVGVRVVASADTAGREGLC